MEQSSCLGTIKDNYAYFSKAERIVADYILEAPNKIVQKTISEVAEDLHVANSTVFRFCKSLGFKGYQAMKIALATEIANPIMDKVEEKITEFDTEQQITEKIFNTTINSYKETMNRMDFTLIKKAVEAIVRADRTEFYGFGNSGLVATDAHHKFIGSGINTAAYTDFHLQQKAASQLTSKDVAIFLCDQPTDACYEVLKMAKTNGATTIGISPFSMGARMQDVDISMHTASGLLSDAVEDGVFTRLIQLSLIDALYVNVINAKEGFLKNSIKKLKSYLGKSKEHPIE